MATVNLRNVDGELVRALKTHAAQDGTTLKALMLRSAMGFIGYEATKALVVPAEAGQDAGEVLVRGALGSVPEVVAPVVRRDGSGCEVAEDERGVSDIGHSVNRKTDPRLIPGVVPACDLPTRKFPIPPCPRCRRPLTDAGQFFECQNSKCRFKRVSAEEVESQFENREG